MKSKRSIQICANRGFTLIELLVATGLGLTVLALALGATISSKRLFKLDLVRTSVNQNLRSALDIIGADIREAGENLTSGFPAIVVIDGGGGAPDELILRRNLLDDVLKLCTAISSGGGASQVVFGDALSTEAGCSYTGNQSKYDSWRAYRIAEGGLVSAFLYDPITKLGEFFDYVSESNASNYLILHTGGTSWQNSYTVNQSSLYMIEEWHFKIENGLLKLVVNQDTSYPLNVIDQVSDFQVSVTLNNGSTLSSFSATDDWTKVKSVSVTITAENTYMGGPMSRSLSGSYFPRNVLSN